MTKLISYLPPVTADLRDFDELCTSEQSLLDYFMQCCDLVRSEYSVFSADDYGLKRYESIFGLDSSGTLDERRSKICIQMQGGVQAVYKIVQTAFPSADIVFSFAPQKFLLAVTFSGAYDDILDDLKELLDDIVPCNVELYYNVIYSTHGEMTPYTHGDLSAYTHAQIRRGLYAE